MRSWLRLTTCALALASFLAACGEGPTEPVTYTLFVVGDVPRVDTAGAVLPQPLVVRVRGSDGSTPAGLVVDFSPSPGSGTVSSPSVATDAEGLAQVTWTLGTQPATASVTATLRGHVTSRTFHATITLPHLRATRIAAGYHHNCAIDGAGRLFCWGYNDRGQLGDGGTAHTTVARPLPGSMTFIRVSAGGSHTCAVTSAKELYCWGRNVWGQIGDGSNVNRLTPTRILPEHQFADVFTMAEGTCAITTAGGVWCWGFMLGSQASAQSPTDVSPSIRFASIGGSDFQVCGVAEDGASYCFVPTAVTTAAGGTAMMWRPQAAPAGGIAGFAGGLQFNCGVGGSGTISCWGSNSYGQLGTGTTDSVPGIAVVTGSQTWRGVFAGYDWACGIANSGATHCWGHNSWGVLGPVVDRIYVIPAPRVLEVPAGLAFTALDGGFYHMCGIAADTRVHCLGGGFGGQLGDGNPPVDFYHRSSPAPVLRLD